VSSPEQACKVLEAAVELESPDLPKPLSCEPYADVAEYYVVTLRYTPRPEELVGSNLLGYFALAKSHGAVHEWEFAEERVRPGAARLRFGPR
jgi:hypothetical protein